MSGKKGGVWEVEVNEVRVVRGRVGGGERDLEPRRDSVTDKRDSSN